MQHVNGKRSRRLPCLARQRPSRRRRPGVPANRRIGPCRRRSKGKHGQGLHARSRVRPARARCRGAAPGSDSGLGGAPASLRHRDSLPTAVAAVDLSDSRGSDTRPAGVPFCGKGVAVGRVWPPGVDFNPLEQPSRCAGRSLSLWPSYWPTAAMHAGWMVLLCGDVPLGPVLEWA